MKLSRSPGYCLGCLCALCSTPWGSIDLSVLQPGSGGAGFVVLRCHMLESYQRGAQPLLIWQYGNCCFAAQQKETCSVSWRVLRCASDPVCELMVVYLKPMLEWAINGSYSQKLLQTWSLRYNFHLCVQWVLVHCSFVYRYNVKLSLEQCLEPSLPLSLQALYC